MWWRGTSRKMKESIQPAEVEATKDRIQIGDKIAFNRKRTSCFDYEDDVRKDIKGKVVIKANHFFVVDTGKWRISYKWTDLITEGAAVKVNGRIFVR